MLSVIFELRIDWYTNKGQTSCTVNERNIVSLRSIAHRDGIGSVHKMIFFITSQQSNGTILCYKTFYTGLQPSETVPMILLFYAPKTLAKFV